MSQTEKELCKAAAEMIVDALIDAGIIKENERNHAESIVEEELVVRKAIRKL